VETIGTDTGIIEHDHDIMFWQFFQSCSWSKEDHD
jgi:hypothetical protein